MSIDLGGHGFKGVVGLVLRVAVGLAVLVENKAEGPEKGENETADG